MGFFVGSRCCCREKFETYSLRDFRNPANRGIFWVSFCQRENFGKISEIVIGNENSGHAVATSPVFT